MIKSYLPKNNPQAAAYLGVMFFLSLAISAFALYKAFSSSFLQFIILIVSLAVATIVSQYQWRIAGTQTVISAKETLIIWAVIWLGIPGAVLLAASTSLANFPRISRSNRHQWVFSVGANILVTFISANIFYLILNNLEGFAGNALAGNYFSIAALFIAASAVTIVHFWLYWILNSTYLSSAKIHGFSDFWKENFKWSTICYAIGFTGALILHFTFLQFGLEFGLIVLPLVVFGHLSYKIHLRRLEQKTKEIREASRIHLATVEALATAIDARDQVGIGHVRRTQIYAIGIGKILNLSEDELQAIKTGALLHDIGKLAVPDNILNKPGRLTPAEMEKTKIHASVGASILEDINFPYPVVPTVRHHHETWDGTGYPDGLAGEDIPITARILCVADAYDTLRGARPYRPAVSREEARKFLVKGAGTQFDPKIVELFLNNLRELEEKVVVEGFSYNEKDQKKFPDAEASENNYIEQIKRANREVFTLYELARVFSSSLNLRDTLELFAKKIGELVQFDTCVVYLIDENTKTAKAAFTKGFNYKLLKDKTIEIGEGATGYVLKKRQSVCNLNPALDFSFDELDLVESYSAMASLPLLAEEKLLGAVSIYSCELENYGEEHMRLLETVSRIASDAIAMALQHAESETRALTDPMTNLPNARSLQIQFEKEVARASRNGSNFQLLMLDLDGFKFVNDTFGHKIGDRLLKELATVMKNELRDYDFLARYAGDEFVAIIPETNQAAVQELGQRIEEAINEFHLDVGDGNFAKVGVSLGSSCYPNDGKTIDQIIIAADKRMYEVKSARKIKEKLPEIPAEEIQEISVPAEVVDEKIEVSEENFIVEVDESHIISNAIN